MSAAVRPETPLTVILESLSIFCDDGKVAVETGVVAAGPEKLGEKTGWGARESALICSWRSKSLASVQSVEAPRTEPETMGGDWIILSIVGCVLYCLMMVVVEVLEAWLFDVAPDPSDGLLDQSSTADAADATWALGGV